MSTRMLNGFGQQYCRIRKKIIGQAPKNIIGLLLRKKNNPLHLRRKKIIGEEQIYSAPAPTTGTVPFLNFYLENYFLVRDATLSLVLRLFLYPKFLKIG